MTTPDAEALAPESDVTWLEKTIREAFHEAMDDIGCTHTLDGIPIVPDCRQEARDLLSTPTGYMLAARWAALEAEHAARRSERDALVAALDETMWPYWRTMAIDPDRHTFEVAVRGMAARLSVFHGLTASAAIEGGR